jgi:hypothetical protein
LQFVLKSQQLHQQQVQQHVQQQLQGERGVLDGAHGLWQCKLIALVIGSQATAVH